MLGLLYVDLLIHVFLDFGREILTFFELCQLCILSGIMHHHFSFLGSLSILLLKFHVLELLDALVFHVISFLFLSQPLLLHHGV